MAKLTSGESSQPSLAGLGMGSLVKLDGGKRIRLDDKVDFWPATGRWRALESGEEGEGMPTLLAFIKGERERVGQSVPKPEPIASRYKVQCQYCGNEAQLHSALDVYPDRKDLADRHVWVCWPCEAWVGCHRSGDGHQPLGSLANEELRFARIAAHSAFDALWRTGELSRDMAYDWLSTTLGLHSADCHIGHMSLQQCKRVLDAVEARRNSL